MNDFYVYIVLNPLKSGNYTYLDLEFDYEPIYVGKGKGNRLEQHSKKCTSTSVNMYKGLFYSKLRQILKVVDNIITIKIAENLEEKDAFNLEILLIDKIGKYINKKGPLYNMSDGGSLGASGRKRSRYKVYCYDSDGKYLKVCKGITEASVEFGVAYEIISKQCMRYKESFRQSSRSGFFFRKIKYKTLKRLPAANSKITYQYTVDNKPVATYKSAKEAEEKTGILRSAIQNNCVGRSKVCVNKTTKEKFIFKN